MNIKLKKILIDIMVIILVFFLFVVWHQKNTKNVAYTTFSNISLYKVYLITTDKGYQYWNILNKGASDMAVASGIKYFWEAPTERNTNKQIEIINNAVESGANALLVAADDPKLISGPVEDAKAKGVKVIYVDSPAYEEAVTTIATDNYEAGVLAGQTMISLLDRQGINSGSIGIINLTEKANTKIREEGFKDTLQKDARFTVLDTIYTESDNPEVTQKAAERIINENKDLVALFGTSEGTSLGVGYAIQANDNKYIGLGFDKTDDMMKLLNSGSLKAIINQNPYTMGYLGMAEAIAAIFGKNTGPEFINTGASVVEKQ